MKGANDDQTRGIDIVRKALQAPLRQIAENAGHDGAVVAGKLIDGNDETLGFNAQTEVYENLVKAGVIDPTKVVRTALQDAASVAGLLITTEAAISEAPEDKARPAAAWAAAAWAAWAAWTSRSKRLTFSRTNEGRGGNAPALFYCRLAVPLPAPLAATAAFSSSSSASTFAVWSSGEVS